MRKPKDPIVLRYKKVDIYLDLNTERFYANDKVTGERWEVERLWSIKAQIDNPKWEPCERELYAVHGGYSAIYHIYAKRRCMRTKKEEWLIKDTTRSGEYTRDIDTKYDTWGTQKYYPISEHNDRMFAKVKELSQYVSDMEKLRDEVAIKCLIK